MTEPCLRLATREDAPVLSRLKIAAWRETYAGLLPGSLLADLEASPYHDAAYWRQRLADPHRWTYLAMSDETVGFCHFGAYHGPTPGFLGIVDSLYVLRRVQGMGCGRRLLRTAARTLARHGLAPMILLVRAANRPAQVFYERLGGRRLHRSVAFRHAGRPVHEIAYGWADLTELAAIGSARSSRYGRMNAA